MKAHINPKDPFNTNVKSRIVFMAKMIVNSGSFVKLGIVNVSFQKECLTKD